MSELCSADVSSEVFEGCYSVEKARKMEKQLCLAPNSTPCLPCGAAVFGKEANSSHPLAPVCSRSHSLRFLALLIHKIGPKVMVLLFVMISFTGGTVHCPSLNKSPCNRLIVLLLASAVFVLFRVC
jgi:hypothetical protein